MFITHVKVKYNYTEYRKGKMEMYYAGILVLYMKYITWKKTAISQRCII